MIQNYSIPSFDLSSKKTAEGMFFHRSGNWSPSGPLMEPTKLLWRNLSRLVTIPKRLKERSPDSVSLKFMASSPLTFLMLSLYFPYTFLCDFVDLDNAFVLDSDPHMPPAGASPRPTVSGVVARPPPWGHDAAVLVFPLSTSTWKMPPWPIYAISSVKFHKFPSLQ